VSIVEPPAPPAPVVVPVEEPVPEVEPEPEEDVEPWAEDELPELADGPPDESLTVPEHAVANASVQPTATSLGKRRSCHSDFFIFSSETTEGDGPKGIRHAAESSRQLVRYRPVQGSHAVVSFGNTDEAPREKWRMLRKLLLW